MQWTDWTKSILALMAWREDREDGEVGMRAVMHVAVNRATLDGRDIVLVIIQDGQFTSINPPGKTTDPELDVWPLPGDVQFSQAMTLAEVIVNKTDIDPTGGAYFYENPRNVKPGSWFERNVVMRGCPKLAIIGKHEYYGRSPKRS